MKTIYKIVIIAIMLKGRVGFQNMFLSDTMTCIRCKYYRPINQCQVFEVMNHNKKKKWKKEYIPIDIARNNEIFCGKNATYFTPWIFIPSHQSNNNEFNN